MQSEIAQHLAQISAAMGFGLSVIGGCVGAGLIFASAIQSVARQPEMANELKTLMFIGFALVEGTAFVGIGVCFLALQH